MEKAIKIFNSEKKTIRDYESRLMKKNGSPINVLMTTIPVLNNEGVIIKYRGVIKDITEQKIAKEKIEWNQNLLQLITDHSGIALYFVDHRFDRIVYYNKRFCEIWGIEYLENRLSEGTLGNKDLIDICSKKVQGSASFAASFSLFDDIENKVTYEDEFKLYNERTFERFSTQITNNNGEYIGRLYTFEDITDRKIYDSILKNERNDTHSIEHFPDAVVIIDIEMKIINANSAFKKMLGYGEEELIGLNYIDLIEPVNLAMYPLPYEYVNQGGTALIERVLRKKKRRDYCV